jgi:glycosyltransferase involved in cell wall biosynthesis
MLVAVSESVADDARRRGLAGRRITVVRNGVPTQGPLATRPTPRSPWLLSTVALFRPRKGLEVLIDALAILHNQGLDVRLHAVGPFETPQYETQIREQIDRLNLGHAIDCVGFSRDVIGHIRATDLFVLPSLYGEGLPMVVLEAMSVGVPVVATRVQGIPEAIRDGLDGLIAAPASAEDLARQIARVIRGEVNWQSLRATALQRQTQEFSDRSMAAGVARVYDQVLSSRGT